MKLLVGLGNPGGKYVGTRHNIGFAVIERFAERHRINLKKKGYQGIYGVGRAAGVETTLLQPQTFMNLSGASVNAAFQSLGVDPGDLIVVYDDLDLPFGALRLRPGGGHGGHNGIRDICSVLGRKDFVRLRFGIGKPVHGNTTGHVLGRFSTDEMTYLGELIETAVDAVEAVLTGDVQTAMNRFNKNLLDSF
ncbi:MAG: aminoacyl-tRNA hydrolase [Desulfuromonas sp.]|nr:MAG: aminoacyl-tRNA hydrolase [Desulfuromonas sp.]